MSVGTNNNKQEMEFFYWKNYEFQLCSLSVKESIPEQIFFNSDKNKLV